jgi:hypothetical protein
VARIPRNERRLPVGKAAMEYLRKVKARMSY